MKRRSFLQVALGGSSLAAAEKAVNALTAGPKVDPCRGVKKRTVDVLGVTTHLVAVPDHLLLWDLRISQDPKIILQIDNGKVRSTDGKFRPIRQKVAYLDYKHDQYGRRAMPPFYYRRYKKGPEFEHALAEYNKLLARFDLPERPSPTSSIATMDRIALWIAEDYVVFLTFKDYNFCESLIVNRPDPWGTADVWVFYNSGHKCLATFGVEKTAEVKLAKVLPGSQL